MEKIVIMLTTCNLHEKAHFTKISQIVLTSVKGAHYQPVLHFCVSQKGEQAVVD